jgi:hypothetical protein
MITRLGQWEYNNNNYEFRLYIISKFQSNQNSGRKPYSSINHLTPNVLEGRRTVSPLKIKIPCKNMREKPTNTPITPRH